MPTITISSENIQKSFAPTARVITIGKASEKVWNAVAVDCGNVSEFQCQIEYKDDKWIVRNGQIRTECPKGLRSDRLIPCDFCMGRCVNLRAGNPRYYWRFPETETLLNGVAIQENGAEIQSGDTISFGDCRLVITLS